MLLIKGKQITLRKLILFLRYKVNTFLSHFRKTEVPFSIKKISEITALIERSKAVADSRILYRKECLFPEIEELELYWGVYKNIIRTYQRKNRFDMYYSWKHLYDCIVNENRLVAKDLFEMWYAQHFQPKRILEIGSRTGRSLVFKMLFHHDIDNTLIFSIDPFIEQGSPAKIKRNLKLLGADPKGLTVFVGYSNEIIPEIKKNWPELYFDFILVDGSHEPKNAFSDLCICTDILKKGGVICFDDLGPCEHELLGVWEKWKEKTGNAFVTKEYYQPYGFGVAQKV